MNLAPGPWLVVMILSYPPRLIQDFVLINQGTTISNQGRVSSNEHREKTMIPEFPQFRAIQLEDREVLGEIIWKYQPQASEWTFTNLFIWRSHYGFQWSLYRDWLLILITAEPRGSFFLPPIGPPPRLEVVRKSLQWLREERGEKNARIERGDSRLVAEIQETPDLVVEPTREQSDYLYRSQDLVQLPGRKYHGKRNHLNKFLKTYAFAYSPLEERHLQESLELGGFWCEVRRCEEDMNLMGEWEAVREALRHFRELRVQGGVLLIQDKVEAFSLGELLNRETAVIHVEKANPEIPGLYPMINQQFCEKNWSRVLWINREQDLGEPGLRKAKESYLPDHLVDKFRIRMVERG